MRIVNEAERIVLVVLAGLPALIVVLDGVVSFLEANPANTLVMELDMLAGRLTPDQLDTVFLDQSELQTTALALIPYGLAAAGIYLIFKFIRAAVQRIDSNRAKSGT